MDSGLRRVRASLCKALEGELGQELTKLSWDRRKKTFSGARRGFESGDRFLTVDVFSEGERPGVTGWLERFPGSARAVYHDSIPLSRPDLAWPHAVARHPHYLSLLAGMKRVYAVSQHAREELRSLLRWRGVRAGLEIEALGLGYDALPWPVGEGMRGERLRILCLGTIEARKQPAAVLAAAENLQGRGVAVELLFLGKRNPRYRRVFRGAVRRAREAGVKVVVESGLSDAGISTAAAASDVAVFASLAEGCGLPVGELARLGLPVVVNDVPALREHVARGWARVVDVTKPAALARVIEAASGDERKPKRVPSWREVARRMVRDLDRC